MNIQYAEDLFINTHNDLIRKAKSGSAFDLVRASGQLRQWLIDGSRLIDFVNREHKLQLRYPLPEFKPGVEHALFGQYDWDFTIKPDILDPELQAPFLTRVPGTRDQLLAYVVASEGRRELKVYDMLTFEANVMGGVHFGTPKSEADRILEGMNGRVVVKGLRVSLQQMIPIIKVVLLGVKPLYIKILRERGVEAPHIV